MSSNNYSLHGGGVAAVDGSSLQRVSRLAFRLVMWSEFSSCLLGEPLGFLPRSRYANISLIGDSKWLRAARNTGLSAHAFTDCWARLQRPLTLIRNFTEVENTEAYSLPPPPPPSPDLSVRFAGLIPDIMHP